MKEGEGEWEEEELRMSLCLFLSGGLRWAHVSVAGCATQVKRAGPITSRLLSQKPHST